MKFTRHTLESFRHTGRSASPHGYATRAFHWLGGALLAYAFLDAIKDGLRARFLRFLDRRDRLSSDLTSGQT